MQPAVIQPPQDDNEGASLLAVISKAASDPSVDVSKLERLMGLYERISDRNAEQAFNTAMTQTQSALTRVAADAANPQTRSRYASYPALDRAVRPHYVANGFSLSFNTDDSPLADHVRVMCKVAHTAGHAETYHVDMPSDGKGAKGGDVMTKTHATGAAMSYGQRYLLKLIFNIAVGEDKDGNAPDEPTTGALKLAIDQLEKAESAEAFKAIWDSNKAGWKGVMSDADYARAVAAMRRLAVSWQSKGAA